jgi:hypothetical protein
MDPHAFVEKWRDARDEHAAAQPHFIDLGRLLGVEDPQTADRERAWFTFERGARKAGGGSGWADVWRKGCFGWEYKSRGRDLDGAYRQLLTYSGALENPPLLIVCDFERYRIHTNWTNTVQHTYDFVHEDLADADTRDRLRAAFLDPDRLRPAKTRQTLTEEAAGKFSALAHRLRERGHEPHAVAHFVNRLVFCMFAEDVGLLPDRMFTRMLEASRGAPADFEGHAATLFGAMKDGGLVGFQRVDWFNGGLFDDAAGLPLEREDIAEVLAAARLDWSDIDPSSSAPSSSAASTRTSAASSARTTPTARRSCKSSARSSSSRWRASGRRRTRASAGPSRPRPATPPSGSCPRPSVASAPAPSRRPSARSAPSSRACAPSACSTPPAARATSSTSRCWRSRTWSTG